MAMEPNGFVHWSPSSAGQRTNPRNDSELSALTPELCTGRLALEVAAGRMRIPTSAWAAAANTNRDKTDRNRRVLIVSSGASGGFWADVWNSLHQHRHRGCTDS